MKFIDEFKQFISKGNVVDMAVGVVIGGSFGKIVTGLVNYIINPFIGIFVKSGNLDSLKTVIHEAVVDAEGVVTSEEVAILWGTWLQTIIDFLITALCIFIVIKALAKAKETANRKQLAAEKAAAAEKEAKEKAEKEAADAAAAAAAARQTAIEDSILAQAKLLEEIKNAIKAK